MSARTLSVILHGHRWPSPTWMQSLRAVLSVPAGTGPASVVEVVDAHEDATTAIGAAAVVNRAVKRATGDLLLIIEAGAPWSDRLLIELITAVWQADVMALALVDADTDRRGVPVADRPASAQSWNPASHILLDATGDGVLEHIEVARRLPLDRWVALVHATRPRLWSVRRASFHALGGLDPQLWSVGAVEDLATRAVRRGMPVRALALARDSAAEHDAWPLRPEVRRFLTIRNSLITAVHADERATRGRWLATVSGLAFAEAWRRAAVTPEALRFGGDWGHQGGLLSRSGRRRSNPLWPADEQGSTLPILALDSFLDALVAAPVDPTTRRDPDAQPATAVPSGLEPTASLASRRQAPDGSESSAAIADTARWPFVSVIVVNWNGHEHLDTCFSSLRASDYPADRFEILCVDNGSTDGSRELLASRYPDVRLVALDENRGFTGGNNAGVAEARGEILAFFNNDMRVTPGAVKALVSAIDAEHPCAAAEVRSWDGRRIDFVRGTVNFEGRGFQDHYGEPWRPERAASADTFFPNGGAFAITRAAYLNAGGFDDAFFAYYDDVDLGFGVRAGGGRIRVVHEALVYHRHGATSRRYPRGQKRFLMERNALWTLLKRYEDATLDRALGAVFLLAARRIAQETVLRRSAAWVQALAPFSARCRRRAGPPAPVSASALYVPAAEQADRVASRPTEGTAVRALPVETLAAFGEALSALPDIKAKRRDCQERRAVSDREVLREMGRGLEYGSALSSYQAAHDALVSTLGLDAIFGGRARVLIITHEPLRHVMSGPGVRALELGRALSADARVTIATPVEPDIVDARCTIAPYSAERPSTLRRLAEEADVLVVQGFTLTQFPFLTALHVPIVVDLYCPFTVEYLEMKTAEARARGAAVPDMDVELEAISILEVQNAQLQHGDFFLCASQRQRDFWLGALHSAGRVNTRNYANDPTLRRLIDVVPFGVPDEEFERAVDRARASAGNRVLKGARPGIGTGDRVLFWGGSLLDWQDPLTLIRAVSRLAGDRSDVKLFFAGTRHPNPQVAPMRAVRASEELARDLGLLDTHVFFNAWVPYDQRAAYLKEADLGLSTHRLHLETHLSFRTRILDYVWAGLPIVCTEGDHFADLVSQRGLGLVVPPEDDAALAGAIARLLDDERLRASCRAALGRLRDEMRWGSVARPLVDFCRIPRFAPDREPAMNALKGRLKGSYRLSKWVKRTALGLGVPEARFEQFKRFGPVQVGMRLRNQIALRRAGRPRG